MSLLVLSDDDPRFLAVHSQLCSRFLLEGGHITEKLFNPARHLQGITGGSVLFKWLIWHVKNAVVEQRAHAQPFTL